MKSFKRARSAGFSLIELLLVIGFIAGALVLAFITYPKVQATNRANTESQHITVISGGIKNLYTTAKNFSTLTPSVLVNAKIIPDDLTVTGTGTAATITNVWGGNINVGPDTVSSRYILTYTAVPASECSKLVTGVGVNFMKVTVGGTTMFDRLAGSTGGAVNIDPATITSACNTGGDMNTIVFTGN